MLVFPTPLWVPATTTVLNDDDAPDPVPRFMVPVTLHHDETA